MKLFRTVSSFVTALAVLIVVLLAPSNAAAQIANEPLVKNLISLGLAHPTSGKLLSGALVDPASVNSGTTQSTDHTLNSVTLDDEMLYAVKRGLIVAAWGTTAANANSKDLKLKFGGTAVCTVSNNTGNNVDFAFVAVLVEDGVDTQRGFCWATVNGALVAAASVNFTAAIDANAAQAIITTSANDDAAAVSATGKGLVVVPLGGS